MRLLIDLGNSRVKWAWQSGPLASLLDARSAAHEGGLCQPLLESISASMPQRIWLSSVAGAAADRLQQSIQSLCPARISRAVSPAQLGGIRNAYAEPARLGVDRFLALLGACARYPAENLLVVDAGTALTIDLVGADGVHRGGSIAPGLSLMRQSLGQGTASLGARAQPPEVELTQLGTDTASAIECGILAAAHAAVALRMAQQADEPPRLLYTGGDASVLAAAFAQSEQLPLLVLEGLGRYADCLEEPD